MKLNVTTKTWLLALPLIAAILTASPASAQAPAAAPAEKKDKKSKSTPAEKAAKLAKNEATRAAFFKSTSDKIPTINITIAPSPGAVKPLTPLMTDPKKYVKASINIGPYNFANVGIHLRGGLGSFRNVNDKAGFTLNMNKFGEKKDFFGMDKWALNNSAQDGSYLSLLVCNEMLRAAGVPAPRISHAIVNLNGMPKGFYCIQEGYDKDYLGIHFKNSDGNFYDSGFKRDVDQPLELIRTKEDVKDHADLKALVAAARIGDPNQRFTEMAKLLDMDTFISGFCIQAILGDWDGYVFNRNNYRVYHNPATNKIFLLPHGLDQEFGNADQGPLVPPMQSLLGPAVFNTPEGKARYLKRMAEINTTVMDTDKWLKRLDDLQAKLQPVIASVDAKAGANYPNEVNRIREFFKVRPKSIDRQLKAAK